MYKKINVIDTIPAGLDITSIIASVNQDESASRVWGPINETTAAFHPPLLTSSKFNYPPTPPPTTPKHRRNKVIRNQLRPIIPISGKTRRFFQLHRNRYVRASSSEHLNCLDKMTVSTTSSYKRL